MTKWSIRNVDPAAIQMVGEVSEISGISYGELLNEIIIDWYNRLPEEAEDDFDIEQAVQALVGWHNSGGA